MSEAYECEDLGTYMATQDWLAGHNLDDFYLPIHAKLEIIRLCDITLTKAQVARKFLSSITQPELFIIAEWMIDNKLGDHRYRDFVSRILDDIRKAPFKFSNGQLRGLMAFVRPDVDKLP